MKIGSDDWFQRNEDQIMEEAGLVRAFTKKEMQYTAQMRHKDHSHTSFYTTKNRLKNIQDQKELHISRFQLYNRMRRWVKTLNLDTLSK